MSSVYKVAYTVNNKVSQVLVFIGSRLVGKPEMDTERLFELEPQNQLFQGVFSDLELEQIADDGSKIVFVDGEIHPDDTVETVKKKIISASPDINAIYSGTYLFAKGEEELDAATVFQTLTQDGKLDLTRERLVDFLLNIDDANVNELEVKEVYSYDDIIALDLPSISPRLVSKPVGQKFVAVEKSFPYSVNPYSVVEYDDFLKQFSSDMIATTNHNLLMETFPIANNTLFVCLAQDVLEFANDNGLAQDTTVQVYFPYLAELGIMNSGDLSARRPELEAETGGLLRDEAWKSNVERVNLFYDVFEQKREEMETLEQGIKSIALEIRPSYTYNLPLDVVFKLIHADEHRPLIKYNPGKRQEKIYRLYADKVATNGKKIPYLSKGTIFKTMKSVGKSKQVSVVMENREDVGSTSLILDFQADGAITIAANYPSAISVSEINQSLLANCNPVIKVVKEFLEQRGYTMNEFTSIYDSSVRIVDMEYVVRAPLKRKMDLKSVSGCLSSLFNIVSYDINKGAQMRFKRVANYNLMDSQEAFLVQKLNQGASDVEVIASLMENFNIKSLEAAREKLVDFLSKQQIVQDAFKGRRMKIKSNPGFETIMMKEPLTSNLMVIVKGIDGVGYLDTIPLYLSSLLILTQDPDVTAVPAERIKALCKSRKETEEKTKYDVVAPLEEPNNEVKALVFGADEEVEKDEVAQNAMLNMLLDESDSDEEDEDDDDEDQEGGARTAYDQPLRDITGMTLHPNPIHERLHDRQPMLFLKEDKPGMKAYSRTCPSNLRRQPIILTEEEKAKIDREHPGSYSKALAYKAAPDQPTYYYICPRYWSLRDDVTLTEEEVESGKYGNVIPRKAKTVGEGETIYELDGKYHQDDKKERISLVPGFYSKKIPGTNMCVPCCFKDWDKPDQVRLRGECLPTGTEKERDDKPVRKAKKRKLKLAAKIDEYVKGPEKFPLEPERLGYLPVAIQKFLHTDNKKCQVSNLDTNIKKDTPCIIRMGAEYSENQSFIAALATALADPGKREAPKTIKKMKEALLSGLDLDKYTRLQNGNLVDIFDSGEKIDVSKYTGTQLFESLERSNPDELNLLKKAVRSFENYKRFIESDDVLIDYQYTWDLVTMSNDNVFAQGINLVIIEIRRDDITDNVHIICPSNHYASTFFDVNKRACILIKRGDLYEPVITYEDKGSKYVITKLFSLKYKGILPNLKSVLDTIKISMNDKCRPLPSKPRVYKFLTNVDLEKVVHIVKLKKFKIDSQVMNYNGQVVGVLVSKGDKKGYVPCFPSAADPSLSSYSWIDSYQGMEYDQTKKFLTSIAKESKGVLAVAPSVKVVDDGLITGIITQGDQFVPIFPPVQDTYGDDLKSISDLDYVAVNKESLTNNKQDVERIKSVRKIHMESSFFDTFRNTVRMLLGKYQHQTVRKDIESIVNDELGTYYSKLTRVDELVRGLMSDKVSFTEYPNDVLENIIDVTTCAVDKERCGDKPYCITSETGCQLLVPSKNLITGVNNSEMYFGRVADEIVRYSRIRSFIFEPKAFLSFSSVKYNLRDDEVILLQSLLNQDYFDDLVPRVENQYVHSDTYDTVDPLNSQVYSDRIIPTNKQVIEQCDKPKISKIAGKWADAFPRDGRELVFTDSPPRCTFDVVQTIKEANSPSDKGHSFNEIKEMLADEYSQLYSEYPQGVIDTWKAEGKVTMAKQVELAQIVIQDLVMSEDYYATLLDVWILAARLNIPVVFYSPTKLPENQKPIMLGHSDGSNSFFFVKVPGTRTNGIPKFRLLVAGNNAKIPIGDVSTEIRSAIQDAPTTDGIAMFLSNFRLKNVRRKLVVVDSIEKKETAPKQKAKKLNKKLVLAGKEK